MSFSVKSILPTLAVCGAAFLFILWFGLRAFGKREHPVQDSTDRAADSWKVPRGVSVYTCDSRKSYESLSSYLEWITQRRGTEKRSAFSWAVVLRAFHRPGCFYNWG